MFKLIVLAALLAIAAADPKPGFVAPAVAYTAPIVKAAYPAYSAYSAGYVSPYAYSGYYHGAYPSYGAYSYAHPYGYSAYAAPYAYARYY